MLTEVFDDVVHDWKYGASRTYLSSTHRTFSALRLYTGTDGRVVRRVWNSTTDTYRYGTDGFAPANQVVTLPAIESQDFNLSTTLVVRAWNYAHMRQWLFLDVNGNPAMSVDEGRVDDTEGSTKDDVTIVYSNWQVPSGNDPASRWTWRVEYVDTWGLSGGAYQFLPGSFRTRWFDFDTHGNVLNEWGLLYDVLPLKRFHEASLPVAPKPQSASGNGIVHVSRMSYDPSGNLAMIERFPNRSGTPAQEACVRFRYDQYSQLLFATERFTRGCDSPGSIVTLTYYDRGLEKVTREVDALGALTESTFDGFGRLASTSKPSTTNRGQVNGPSTVIDYVDTSFGLRKHTRAFNGAAFYDYWEYLDGFGRTILAVSPADITAGDPLPWVVSGHVLRGAKGKLVASFPPSFYGGDA